MSELIVGCPTCGEVNEDLANLESQNRQLLRKVGRLQTELAQQRKDSPQADAVARLFARWQGKLGHPKAKLGPGRETALLRALAMFDEETVAKAIDGCALMPFVGAHGRQLDDSKGAKRHDDLPLICRDETTVERFAGYVDNPAENPQAPPSLAVRLSRIDRTEALAWGFYRASHGTQSNWTDDMRGLWLKVTLAALEFGRSYKRTRTPVEGGVVEMPSAHPLELRNVLEAFAERGLDVTGQGAQFKGQCPLGDRHANGDRTPSCSITEKPDGRTLLNCFGCGAGHLELARALDLYRRANGHGVSVGQVELEAA